MINKVFLASPRGFCAGVERAILIVEKSIEKFGTPIYVNHEIVHNQFVVKGFEKKGVIFTENLEEIPKNSVYIFSAHGISPKIREKAKKKNLKIIDATCPLVTKVHWEAEKFDNQGAYCFYIGQKNHQEYLGVKGVAPLHLLSNQSDVEKISANDFVNKEVICLTQTTLSVDDTSEIIESLKSKIPHIRIPGDICYATTNRQESVKTLCEKVDYLIVIGSQNSSNSQKLVSVSKKYGTNAQLFENMESIPEEIFEYKTLGITSGASVPEILIEELLDKIKRINPNINIKSIETKKEDFKFPLPKEFDKKSNNLIDRRIKNR